MYILCSWHIEVNIPERNIAIQRGTILCNMGYHKPVRNFNPGGNDLWAQP